MKEIEVKAHLRDEQQVIDNLTKLGVALSAPVSQRDRVFFPKGFRFGQGIKAPALRIREQDGTHLFTYKIPDKYNLDKIEYESKIEDPQAMAHICEALGFELVMRLNKVRRKAVYQDYEICLDEVEGLGSYIEAEKMVETGDSGQIQKELFGFLQTLGVLPEDQVDEGYDIMLFKKGQPT